MLKKIVIALSLLSVLSIASNGLLWARISEVRENLREEKKAKEKAIETLADYKNNTDAKVKGAAEKFLKAFLEVDSKNNEDPKEKIKPYTTEKGREQLQIPSRGEKLKTEVKIVISDMTLYYSQKSPDTANILADVKRKTFINEGSGVESQDFIELQLVQKNGKWLVDNTRLIPKLKSE